MRILVITGSRHLFPKEELRAAFTEVGKYGEKASFIITGDAAGVDHTAAMLAHEMKIATIAAKAWWNDYDKAAGHIRNNDMATLGAIFQGLGHDVYAHAFPAADSIGTYRCVERLGELGIPGVMHDVPLYNPGGIKTVMVTGIK